MNKPTPSPEQYLATADPVMAELVKTHGPLDGQRRRRNRPADAYASLVRSIVGQQLSVKAAASIYQKFIDRFDGHVPEPAQLLKARTPTLRKVGLSGAKVVYLRDLAARIEGGRLDLKALPKLSDEDVIAALTEVKGLGPWTADMFLMFHLGRPDVLPVGDLGIRRAVEQLYRLKDLPGPEDLRRIAEPWRPYRTTASIYLWESLDNAPVDNG